MSAWPSTFPFGPIISPVPLIAVATPTGFDPGRVKLWYLLSSEIGQGGNGMETVFLTIGMVMVQSAPQIAQENLNGRMSSRVRLTLRDELP